MHKYRLSRDEALAQLRQGRPLCQPNDGFMEQLDVYQRMLQAPDAAEAESIYQSWLKSRSLAGGEADSKPAKL